MALPYSESTVLKVIFFSSSHFRQNRSCCLFLCHFHAFNYKDLFSPTGKFANLFGLIFYRFNCDFRLQLLERPTKTFQMGWYKDQGQGKEEVREGRNEGKKGFSQFAHGWVNTSVLSLSIVLLLVKNDKVMANSYLRVLKLTCKNYFAAVCSLLKSPKFLSTSIICCHRKEFLLFSSFKNAQEVTCKNTGEKLIG